MSLGDPGIVVSIHNQLVTPQVESEIKQISMSVLTILRMVQLVRLSYRDIQQIIEGDIINVISLVTNILIMVGTIRAAILAIKAKQTALLAMELAMYKDLTSIREMIPV